MLSQPKFAENINKCKTSESATLAQMFLILKMHWAKERGKRNYLITNLVECLIASFKTVHVGRLRSLEKSKYPNIWLLDS